MKQTPSQLRKLLIDALLEIVPQAAFDKEISESTNPIKDLGLDSLDGIELACALSSKLNYHISDHLNPLVDDVRHRARNIREIVEFLQELLLKEREVKHA